MDDSFKKQELKEEIQEWHNFSEESRPCLVVGLKNLYNACFKLHLPLILTRDQPSPGTAGTTLPGLHFRDWFRQSMKEKTMLKARDKRRKLGAKTEKKHFGTLQWDFVRGQSPEENLASLNLAEFKDRQQCWGPDSGTVSAVSAPSGSAFTLRASRPWCPLFSEHRGRRPSKSKLTHSRLWNS